MSGLSKIEEQKLKRDLEECETLKEIFDVIGEYYDVENCRPGFIAKGVLIKKLSDNVKLLGAKPRKKRTDVYY